MNVMEISSTAPNLVDESSTGYPSRYLEGVWQEEIIWIVTTDLLNTHLGKCQILNLEAVDVRLALTYTYEHETYRLTWYKPNTHPVKPFKVSKPDFGITQNGTQLINIESKNWAPNYKPLSLYQTDTEIISRFRYLSAPHNILIISELNLQPDKRILKLLSQYAITPILTHRKAEYFDHTSYQIIKKNLQPTIMKPLKLGQNKRHKT